MSSDPRTLRRLALALALPATLASSVAVDAQSALKAPARAAVPAAPARLPVPDNSVIALPLTPIVPPAQRLCATRLPSGLGYTILRAASGAQPPADATVLVNYVGYLAATGAVFDQAMQAPFPVEGVIPGFSEGLRMIARGGVFRFCIPAALGYGEDASGPIPANSDLVFQVELLDFRTAAELDALRNAQATPPPSPVTPPPQE